LIDKLIDQFSPTPQSRHLRLLRPRTQELLGLPCLESAPGHRATHSRAGVPPLGECRPAYTDLAVGDAGGPSITLHAEGEVCSVLGAWVIHDFRGRFEVSAYSKRGWKNITGFAEVKAVNGLSDVYATS